MNTVQNFKIDPERDATDSIRGYVYQIYQSVLAWMQLKEDEILVLEGSEDFDVHSSSSVTTTQVKDLAANITLRSQAVKEILNNYWSCCQKNPKYNIAMRFLTTAEIGQENGSPFGTGQKGIEYWRLVESEREETEPLRNFLLTLDLDQDLTSFIKKATDEDFNKTLISRIKWDTGNKPREPLQYLLEDKLKIHGMNLHINSHYSCQALPHLIKKVADLMSVKGLKELRFGDFLSCFDEATTLTIPRGQMEAITQGNPLQQLANLNYLSEVSRLSDISTMVQKPTPIVNGGIPRSSIVSNIDLILQEQRIVFLNGSSGLGKTTLASLICHKVEREWIWIGLRGFQPDQIKDILIRCSIGINKGQLSPFIVLDDIDFSEVTIFEREIISVIFSTIEIGGMVIITGPTDPPSNLLPKLWKKETCKVDIPYFDENDVRDMVYFHGLSDSKNSSAWAKTIWTTTSGHPQLVHARVRTLSEKGWPKIKMSDLLKPEDIEKVKSEARTRLVKEFPTEDTRILAYRLSLISGTFARETALALAEYPPATKLPGESFDALIGPWIEKEGENRYRISPLLAGAANNTLGKSDIKKIHGSIAQSILDRKEIDQIELCTAFFHAFVAKHLSALTSLAYVITTTGNDKISLISDMMSWFNLVSLEEGQKIIVENPSLDFMLRLVQYKLTISSTKPERALQIIERIEESFQNMEPPEFKEHSEGLAYGMILNSLEAPIPSSVVIRMLSRMIDLVKKNPFFTGINDSFIDRKEGLPRLGENKPVQILFSYQSARLAGVNDLLELILALDSLVPNKREELLKVCDSDIDFAHLLVSQAWWKDVENGVLNVDKAIEVFELMVEKSQEWGFKELTRASFVAISVILDEYGQSSKKALEILDFADKEFPDNANLINQRAKVLFHNDRNAEALPIARKALELKSLSNVDFVFCCRLAGIASAKLKDWLEAERLFLLGAEKANRSSFQKSMGTGLMADAAFARWKQKKYEQSLLLYADTLDMLQNIPLSDDLRIYHLHATVRHSIFWIHFKARKSNLSNNDFAEPLPGMCSNQEPHKDIKDHRILDIGSAWELLSFTEQALGLNIGIKARSKKTTSDEKSFLFCSNERIFKFEQLFKSKNFNNLIPTIIEMLEVFHYSKTFKDYQTEIWGTGNIPKLPNQYWDNSDNWIWIFNYTLVASIIITVDNNAQLPTEKWRQDLIQANVVVDKIDQFLKILDGESTTDDSLYQQAANSIYRLKNETISPKELWLGSFRLLDALKNEKRLVEHSIERLLIERWLFAIQNQRFAFSSPSYVCPEIDQCCLDSSLNGMAKIAAVLKIAAPYLQMRLSDTAKQMIEKIIQQM